MKKYSSSDAVRARVLCLLARREHSRHELEQKLRSKVSDPTERMQISTVLNECAAADLQSDARFTDSYIRSRYRAGYGPIRIRQELLKRGIRENLIDTCQTYDWAALLKQVWQKKFRSQKPMDVKQYGAQLRFLLHRGFIKAMIIELVGMCPYGIYDES